MLPASQRPQRVTVRVPASTANLGPGFDCLGMALDITDDVTVAFADAAALEDGAPVGAGAAHRSLVALAAGKATACPPRATLADGLATTRLGDNAFAIARDKVDRIISVSEEQIALSILRLIELEKTVVEGAGYEVVGIARDTAGAERLVAQHHPALAIVDMKLELDVDGIATATVLKQKHGLAILITTGFPDTVVQREGVDRFACAIVRKPYSDEEVLEAVERCIGRAGGRP